MQLLRKPLRQDVTLLEAQQIVKDFKQINYLCIACFCVVIDFFIKSIVLLFRQFQKTD